MRHKTISQNTIWIGAAIIVASIVTLAFATLAPRSRQQYIATYKDLIRSRSISSLYAEPAQEANNSTDKNSKGTLEAISFENNKIDVIVCLDLPDTGSWIPDAAVKIKDETIEWSDFSLINSKDPATYTSTNRCFLISFPYSKTDEKKIHVGVSVSLFQDNSSDLATNDGIKKIKDKLQVNYPGLDFAAVAGSGNGGGGGGILIKSKPSNMSDDEALELISDATIVKGNGTWNFDVEVP